MDQVSLPMRIALGAVLSFAALWFVALRPKPISDVPIEPAPIEQAAPAKSAKPEPAGKAEKAAADPAPAKPKPARAERKSAAEAILGDLDAGRAVVLLFWDGRSSADLVARRAVSAVDRRGGKVAVHVARLKQLGRYATITQDVPVTGSPSTLVIGPDRKATAIPGLTVTSEIEDVVSRAIRAAKK